MNAFVCDDRHLEMIHDHHKNANCKVNISLPLPFNKDDSLKGCRVVWILSWCDEGDTRLGTGSGVLLYCGAAAPAG